MPEPPLWHHESRQGRGPGGVGKYYKKFVDIISAFNQVRDIPYRIPLTLTERDDSCNGKHRRLKALWEKEGYEVRYRVYTFRWSSIKNVPQKILGVSDDDMGTHVYLEMNMNGKWIRVDATWDIGLKSIFPVNEWDGRSSTALAVKPIAFFSLEKSAAIMARTGDQEILADLKINGAFYRAFNDWLAEIRSKK